MSSLQAAFFPSDLESRYIGALGDHETNDEKTKGYTGVLGENDYKNLHSEFIAKANTEQKDFFEKIKLELKARVNERKFKKLPPLNTKRLHFITGDGGVGKTFLYNVIVFYSLLVFVFHLNHKFAFLADYFVGENSINERSCVCYNRTCR